MSLYNRDGFCHKCMSMFSSTKNLRALCTEAGYTTYSEEDVCAGMPVCEICNPIWTQFQLDAPKILGLIRIKANFDDPTILGPGGEDGFYPMNALKMRSITAEYVVSSAYIPGLKHGDDLIARMEKVKQTYDLFWSSYQPRRHVDTTIPSLHSLDHDYIIKNALNTLNICLTTHRYCPDHEIPLLPTRVIDIGFNEKGAPAIKLHVPSGNERAYYIALSYCWGDAQRYIATNRTISAMMKEIPERSLPRTIRQAVDIARRLKIRYLWVDALCIIQDNAADISKEINKMASIYKSATLTIAAGNSDGVDAGFLAHKPQINGLKVPFQLPAGQREDVKLVKRTEWLRHYQKGPLDNRGWVLQEFLLSPRVLIFGMDDTIWQCRTAELESMSHIGYKHFRPTFRVNGDENPILNLSFHVPLTNSKDRFEFWCAILVDYSGRKLGVNEDRLPAISGIVGELQQQWNDEYMAGLWKSDIVRGLWWEVLGHPRRASDASNLSPTWSWVSINHAVTFSYVYNHLKHVDAEFISCKITLVDDTCPLGQVRDAVLALRASLLDASDILTKEGVQIKDHDYKYSWTVEDDVIIQRKDYESHEIVLEDTAFLRLGSERDLRDNKLQWREDRVKIHGLILKRFGKFKFTRVGIFSHIDYVEGIWKDAPSKIVTIV